MGYGKSGSKLMNGVRMMADREKVMRGLEACNRQSYNESDCENCPYYDDEDTAELPFGMCNIQDMFDDALALLKEQEAKELSESCENCSEYDNEKHYCPRFCKVIPETIAELKSSRLMTVEEISDCNEGDCFWMEDHDCFCGNVLFVNFSQGYLVDMRSATHRFSYEIDTYMRTWRLWTKEPTIDQRMNTPWEGK